MDALPLEIHDETHLRNVLKNPNEALRFGLDDNIHLMIHGPVSEAVITEVNALRVGSGKKKARVQNELSWTPVLGLTRHLILKIFAGKPNIPNQGRVITWSQKRNPIKPDAAAEFRHVLDVLKTHGIRATVFGLGIPENALHAWQIRAK